MDYFSKVHDSKSDKEYNGYANHKIILDSNGNPIKVLGVLQDITESKAYENKLLQNNDEMTAIYEELTASEEELRQQVDRKSILGKVSYWLDINNPPLER